MTAGALVASCLAGALMAWPDRPGPPGMAVRSGSGGADRATLRLRRWFPTFGVGFAVLALLPGSWWWAGCAAGATAVLTLRRPGRGGAVERRRARRSLAVRLDLLAACLAAGLPVPTALAAVAGAFDDQDSGAVVLAKVGALLALGAEPARAWQPAIDDPDLAPVAVAAGRSADGGAPFAGACSEQAAELRRLDRTAGSAAAGRAGVAMTAPLGLCFLPAFLCLGLAPVVIGLLSELRF